MCTKGKNNIYQSQSKSDTSSLIMTIMTGLYCTALISIPAMVRCSDVAAVNWETEILRSGIPGKRSNATIR